MTTTTSKPKRPTPVLHPGTYVDEFCENNNLTYAEFARLANMDPQTVLDITQHELSIGPKEAERLAHATSFPVEFWLIHQHRYNQRQSAQTAQS